MRKYIKDLGAAIEVDRYVDGAGKFIGFPVYRLAMTPEQAQAYLTGLAAAPEARRTRASASALSIAAKDPSRHFHILADDTHYAVRVSRSPVARDPLVAALFGPVDTVFASPPCAHFAGNGKHFAEVREMRV